MLYNIHNGHFMHLDFMGFCENCKLDSGCTWYLKVFIYLFSYLISDIIKNCFIIIQSAKKLPKVKIADTDFQHVARPKKMMQKF